MNIGNGRACAGSRRTAPGVPTALANRRRLRRRTRGRAALLNGDRVLLRPIERDDLPELWRLVSDFEVALLSSTEPVRPLSLAAFEAMHERFVSENVTDAVGFALEVNGDLVGTCGLHAIDHFNSRCEVGIAIGRDHWGRGLGQDAVRTLVRYAFDHLNMHRVA